jgi:hypothetical protein
LGVVRTGGAADDGAVGAACGVVGEAAGVVGTGGVGVTGAGTATLGGLATFGAEAAWPDDFARGAGCGLAGAGTWIRVVGGRLAGASPTTTDGGSEDRPMPGAASRLAAQATVAVATMPSTAAAAHSMVRLLMFTASYSSHG